MPLHTSEQLAPPVRLDSWKSIAHHLGRSSRTVQRWHLIYGLPIYHIGGNGSSVFAYPHELDLWMREGRGRDRAEKKPELTIQASPPTPLPAAYPAKKTLPLMLPSDARERSRAFVEHGARIWSVLSPTNLKWLAHSYRAAIDEDCTNAAAFAGLSSALTLQALLGEVDGKSAYMAAKAALNRAAQIDPELPEVECTRAWIDLCSDQRFDKVRVYLQEAASDNALTSRIQVALGLMSIAEGRLDEADDLLHDACKQSALNVVWSGFHVWNCYLRGDRSALAHRLKEERNSGRSSILLNVIEALMLAQSDDFGAAVARLRVLANSTEMNPVARGALGYSLARAGDEAGARAELKLIESQPEFRFCNYAMALIQGGLGEMDAAMRHLEESRARGTLWSLGFAVDPIMKPLHALSRKSNGALVLPLPKSRCDESSHCRKHPTGHGGRWLSA